MGIISITCLADSEMRHDNVRFSEMLYVCCDSNVRCLSLAIRLCAPPSFLQYRG